MSNHFNKKTIRDLAFKNLNSLNNKIYNKLYKYKI